MLNETNETVLELSWFLEQIFGAVGLIPNNSNPN